MNSIPRLETERLKLRAIFPADAPAICQLMSDPKVTRFHELEPMENIQQAHEMISNFTQWFQNNHAVRWGILLKETGELIGSCCFDTFHLEYQSVNVGYNLRSDHWGKGFATEAVKAIIRYAFEYGIASPINRIEAITIPNNVASEKVLLKLGFQKEGLMRQYGFWNDSFHDMNLFSLLKSEFEP
jgi:ribosomal-protein-alanine N-acetyltransferase